MSAFWSSDLSPVVKEAALFNLSTLRSQTFFRTADGYPFGWEGCLDNVGSCLGSCTHVWNYELATSFLFGSMARQMRELEYLHATAADGAMSFRIMLPLSRAQEYPHVAADGQFGCVVKLLQGVAAVRRRRVAAPAVAGVPAIDRICLDRRRMGRRPRRLSRGGTAQHDGYRVLRPQPGGPVVVPGGLGGRRGDGPSRRRRRVFANVPGRSSRSGAASTEALLFNGQYYQQKVMPPGDFSRVAPRLRHTNMGAENPNKPEFQVEDGCLTDQLLGDTYGRLVGLGPVFGHGARGRSPYRAFTASTT